jgi:hypothetical protein
MSIDWREDGPSAIVVEQRGSWIVRLFGLPFLGVGGNLLYQIADGVRNADLTVAGWIGLPLAAATFLVPGWLLCFARRRTRLDLAERAMTEELDLLVFRRRKTYAVPTGATVRVRHELRRTGSDGAGGSRTHLFCPVELELEPGRQVLVAELDGKEAEDALQLARRVGALYGIRVHDERKKEGETIEEVGAEDADDE